MYKSCQVLPYIVSIPISQELVSRNYPLPLNHSLYAIKDTCCTRSQTKLLQDLLNLTLVHILTQIDISHLPPIVTIMDVWNCCNCGANNLDAIAPACPLCGHEPCSTCTQGPQSFWDPSGTNISPFQHSSDNRVIAYQNQASLKQHSVYHSRPHPQNGYPTRPDMRGWWTCCQCRQTNNPRLAPERCSGDPDCLHYKCDWCTVY